MNEFILCNTLEKRTSSSCNIMSKYPDKVPIIVVLPKEFTKQKSFFKYLISKDLNIQYMIHLIRKNIKIDPAKAIFLLTEDGTLSTGNKEVGDLYFKHKNTDGYMYIYVKVENCFGN